MRIRDLAAAYTDSRAFRRLHRATQSHYLLDIKTSRHGFLSKDANRLTEVEVDELYAWTLKTYGVAKAFNTAKIFRVIFTWGVRQGHLKGNPWSNMRVQMPKPRTVVWTKEQFATAIAACKEVDYKWLELLLEMCYYLSQGPGDCLKASPEHLVDDFIVMQRSKTSRIGYIYVPLKLRAKLEAIRDTPLPNGDTPSSFFPSSIHMFTLMTQFRAVRRYGLLPDNLQIRDLRRTAVIELADAEATDQEIRATSLHSDRSSIMQEVYALRTAIQSKKGQLKRFPEDVKNDDDSQE